MFISRTNWEPLSLINAVFMTGNKMSKHALVYYSVNLPN